MLGSLFEVYNITASSAYTWVLGRPSPCHNQCLCSAPMVLVRFFVCPFVVVYLCRVTRRRRYAADGRRGERANRRGEDAHQGRRGGRQSRLGDHRRVSAWYNREAYICRYIPSTKIFKRRGAFGEAGSDAPPVTRDRGFGPNATAVNTTSYIHKCTLPIHGRRLTCGRAVTHDTVVYSFCRECWQEGWFCCCCCCGVCFFVCGLRSIANSRASGLSTRG